MSRLRQPRDAGVDRNQADRCRRSTSSATRCKREAPFPLSNAKVLGPLIIEYGTEETKREMLPKMRRGDFEFVLGFTEPKTGSDVANLATSAVRQGDGYRQKLYEHPKPSDIMVSPHEPTQMRPSAGACPSCLPIPPRKASAAPKVQPSVGRTLARPVARPRPPGWHSILPLPNALHSHFPTLFGMVINYAKTNVGLDGRPLTEQQWVRERHAELAIEIEAAQLIQDMTASKVAADVKVGIEASVVKAYCTDLERGIAAFGSELVGPVAPLTSYTDVHPFVGALSFLSRLKVAMTIVRGPNEIQRNVIPLQRLGLPRA